MLPIRRLGVLLVSLLGTPGLAATYRLDPDRTFPQFEIDQLWLFTQRGRLEHAHGTLEYDPEQHAGRLEVSIDASSLDTGNDERDADLKGPRWFDIRRHPSIVFRSQRFIFEQDRLVAIEGELTLRGVTQPMRLKINRITCESGPLSRRQSCSADASGALQRSRFGMRSDLPFIGDEVRLRIQAEAHLEH